MATPKGIVAGSSAFSEAVMNRFILGDGTKIQIKIWYATVVYSGGTLILQAGADVCGFVAGDFSYNAGTDILEVTLSGFTNIPFVGVERLSAGTNYIPQYKVFTNTQAQIEFYDPADLTTKVTPGAPDANMNFTIFVIGY